MAFIENEDPLNAIVMVSNAFTSNGYAILGDTTGGKINSIILVWSGYILSGAATATLTVSILMRRFKSKLEDYDKKLDELQESLNELKRSIIFSIGIFPFNRKCLRCKRQRL